MKKNNDFFLRILKIIDFKGVSSVNEFSTKYLGYSASQKINRLKNTQNKPSFDIVADIVNKFEDINANWLLTGKGEMLKADKLAIATVNDKDVIPLVSVTAIGRFGNASFNIESRDVKALYKIPKFQHKRVDFMIEIEGSSMYPKYNSGDVVACTIIRESQFIQWNKVHVVATSEQGIIIKRIKKSNENECLKMVSDNKSYDPFDVPINEITGIALVSGVIRLE